LKAIGIALLAGLAVASASLLASSASPVGGAARQPYDLTSSADRKLLHFDRSHPACELWTDWRKLCSRMGPDGETTCRTDPYYSAEPSEPFCARGEAPSSDTLAAGLSRSRYCVQFMLHPPPRLTEPAGARYCIEYSADRPFGGGRIGQVETPDCLEWARANAPGCVADKEITEPFSCGAPRIRDFRGAYPYICTRWSPRAQCQHPVGDAEPDRGRISMLEATMLSAFPVWGVYCKRAEE
jgi:hypothetical protein